MLNKILNGSFCSTFTFWVPFICVGSQLLLRWIVFKPLIPLPASIVSNKLLQPQVVQKFFHADEFQSALRLVPINKFRTKGWGCMKEKVLVFGCVCLLHTVLPVQGHGIAEIILSKQMWSALCRFRAALYSLDPDTRVSVELTKCRGWARNTVSHVMWEGGSGWLWGCSRNSLRKARASFQCKDWM